MFTLCFLWSIIPQIIFFMYDKSKSMKTLSLVLAATAALVATSAMAQPVVEGDHLSHSKPSAYNAETTKRADAQGYVCEAGQNVTVRQAALTQVEVTVDGEKALLDRESYVNRGALYFTYETNKKVKFSTKNGLAGGYTSWNQKRYDQGTLVYTNAEGLKVRTHCEAAQ